MSTRVQLVVVATVAVTACTTTTTRTIPTTRFYGYTVVSTTSLDREDAPTPPDRARAAITKLRRVAFVPPDSCLDMRAADTGTTVEKRVLRMQCGVTMSELEREAARVGFDIVTWQSLKGGQKPLEMAREQNIDLLFEINELDVIEEHTRSSAMEFRYFSGDGDGKLQPLDVSEDDNEACKAYHAQNAPQISGLTSVLDVKMVQVSNGSVLWSYRHVENAKAEDASALVRFPVRATQTYQTRRPWWPWLVVGAGGIVIAIGQPLPGAAIASLGALGVVALPKHTTPVGDPVYEPVSAVLCRRPHLVDAPLAGADAPKAKKHSTSFRSETKLDAKDAVEERRRELIKKSVGVFMVQLASR